MRALLLLILNFAMTGISDAVWCVCRSDISEANLQKTLDYACGAGADCAPILPSGVCYMPNTVRAHCSYAANSYFQRKGQTPGSCDFAGTATGTGTNPSYGTCTYPTLASSPTFPGTNPGGTTTTAPVVTTPTVPILPPPSPTLPPPTPSLPQGFTLPPPSVTPTTTIPNTFTPTTTVGGGGVIGFQPPAGMNSPSVGAVASHGVPKLRREQNPSLLLILLLLLFSATSHLLSLA